MTSEKTRDTRIDTMGGDALARLIEAVEAGVIKTVSAHAIKQATGKHCQMNFVSAFNGSLDAAKALHDALLPGWRARMDVGRKYRVWVISPQNAKLDAYSDNPARAWLLAILRALQSEGRT